MNNELTINEVRELKQKAENEIKSILSQLQSITGVRSIGIDFEESKIFNTHMRGIETIYSYKFDINLKL